MKPSLTILKQTMKDVRSGDPIPTKNLSVTIQMLTLLLEYLKAVDRKEYSLVQMDLFDDLVCLQDYSESRKRG